MIKNSQGNIYYGMHFYPGVAEYAEPGREPYRVFLNENTIRNMGPSFAGRPIFVEHVDEVSDDIDQLKKDADGWVIESFYNAADGKHWVKFIVVSERGEKAIERGYRLSNAYFPEAFGQGGEWNGVRYEKEILGGKYEHLAIVNNPRYQESEIMTPDEFKRHNEKCTAELKRLANSKKEITMGFNIFERKKVENSKDLEKMVIVLPKSGREITITQMVNEMDAVEEAKKANDGMADPKHNVKLHDGSVCNVAELLEKHKSLNEELEAMKKKNKDVPESELELEDVAVDVEGDDAMENEEGEADVDVESLDNEEDDEKAKKEAEEKAAKEKAKKNAADKAKKEADAKKAAAKEKADRLRNAHHRADAGDEEEARVEFSADQIERGKSRYGSN